MGCLGFMMRQKRLRLSWKVDECKPLYGGALGKMLPTFQIFAGGPMGDGAQWFSWVGRCGLTVSEPRLKAPMVSALEAAT